MFNNNNAIATSVDTEVGETFSCIRHCLKEPGRCNNNCDLEEMNWRRRATAGTQDLRARSMAIVWTPRPHGAG